MVTEDSDPQVFKKNRQDYIALCITEISAEEADCMLTTDVSRLLMPGGPNKNESYRGRPLLARCVVLRCFEGMSVEEKKVPATN